MANKKRGSQLLQDWMKKDLVKVGTRIKVIKSVKRIASDQPLWTTPLIATVKRVDDWDQGLPVGFVPDDPTLNPSGHGNCWWCPYDWVEILDPKEDPLNTEQVTPSQEVMTE
jgi:hypothetical protein